MASTSRAAARRCAAIDAVTPHCIRPSSLSALQSHTHTRTCGWAQWAHLRCTARARDPQRTCCSEGSGRRPRTWSRPWRCRATPGSPHPRRRRPRRAGNVHVGCGCQRSSNECETHPLHVARGQAAARYIERPQVPAALTQSGGQPRAQLQRGVAPAPDAVWCGVRRVPAPQAARRTTAACRQANAHAGGTPKSLRLHAALTHALTSSKARRVLRAPTASPAAPTSARSSERSLGSDSPNSTNVRRSAFAVSGLPANDTCARVQQPT